MDKAQENLCYTAVYIADTILSIQFVSQPRPNDANYCTYFSSASCVYSLFATTMLQIFSRRIPTAQTVNKHGRTPNALLAFRQP